jgi:hypothetical protein
MRFKTFIIAEAGVNHNCSPHILAIFPKTYNQGPNHENNV